MAGPEARRTFIIGALGTLAAACKVSVASAPPTHHTVVESFRRMEEQIGGRLGVFVLDTGSGRKLGYRADERFAMCSTFKWALAACVLARADRADLDLHDKVAYGPADLLEHAPVCRAHVQDGSLSLQALARAVVTVSDNTAANLLLRQLGGPVAFTQFCRSLGDRATRLDRWEPALNGNDPGDERDTTTPRAMSGLMSRILCGDALSMTSRDLLLAWLRAVGTGKERLRAGLPHDWDIGDKTGTGNNGACHDIAIALPPGRAPLLLAVYMSDGRSELDVLQAAHADVARVVVREIGV